MSLLDRYIANHSKVYWDTDKKKEATIRDRQEIASDFHSGHSLAHILDDHSSEPKYESFKEDNDWGVMVFDKANGRPLRCERPCIDDSILWQDHGSKEALAITYRKSVFEQQMHRYWGCSNG